MPPNFIVFALIAAGVIAFICVTVALLKRRNSSQFTRIQSLPCPPRSLRSVAATDTGQTRIATMPEMSRVTTTRSTRLPVTRAAESDPTLPMYTRTSAEITPPPPVYNPRAPQAHTTIAISAPNQTSFPVSRPPSVTPYVPSPTPSLRPPSYRSGHSSNSIAQASVPPLPSTAGFQAASLAEAGHLPPRYEVAAR